MPIPRSPSPRRRFKLVAYLTAAILIPSAALLFGLLPASAATAGPITGIAGKCVDIAGAATNNGAAVQLYTCNGTGAQQWTLSGSTLVNPSSGRCLDVASGATTNGAPVQIYDCNSTSAQKWSFTNGELVNSGSGKCLDATGQSSADGTRLQIWSCTGTSNQLWSLSGGGTTPPTTTPTSQPAGSYTAAQVLAGVQKNMTTAKQVNTKPHINTMTRDQNVNVYQVANGVFAYSSSLAVDDDGSDPDSDPDHQGETTFQDSNGAQLAAHHVPFYVLGDDCWDRTSPCPHFFYKEHGISGRQFALMFYKSKCIGAIFGDTQTGNSQTTSDNDSRELGEASVESAALLGIPSSGTTGGVDNGVTVVIFSGSSWVINGTNANLNSNAQAQVTKALNSLGSSMGL
jgi:ricin-type beta-trefoil lectin protein/glycosyl hydrolase group 75 (putative chitosanase)